MRTLRSIDIWASGHPSASLEVGRVSLVIGICCKSPSERLLKCNCSSLKLLRGLKSSVIELIVHSDACTGNPYTLLHGVSRSMMGTVTATVGRLHRLKVLGACLPNRSCGPSWTAKKTHPSSIGNWETILNHQGVFQRSFNAISSPFISEVGWVPPSSCVVVDPLGGRGSQSVL